MNHIQRLTHERDVARAALSQAREALTDLLVYLLSSKFAGADCDHIHVRTDLLPRLSELRRLLNSVD